MSIRIKKKRSPRAPSISLEDAIDRAIKIYNAEGGRHPVPNDVVAKHLGYTSSRNGTAVISLASLRYYGLLERPEEGHLSVSKDLEAYIYAPNEGAKHDLSRKWLETPKIFSSLLEKYPLVLPTDETLIFALINMGFNKESAANCASAFRKSADFSRYYDQDTIAPNEEGFDESEDNASPPKTATGAAPQAQGIVQPPQPEQGNASQLGEVDRIPVRLSGGRKTWLEIPSPFYSSDKKRIKAQIDLLLTDDEEEEVGE